MKFAINNFEGKKGCNIVVRKPMIEHNTTVNGYRITLYTHYLNKITVTQCSNMNYHSPTTISNYMP